MSGERASQRRHGAAAALLALAAAYAAATNAAAQGTLASPAAAADAAPPVRIVCIAETPEAFLRDETFRERVLARLPAALPAGGDATARLRALIVPHSVAHAKRYLVAVGSGFVVDAARGHVVTAWHVATACASDRMGVPGGRAVGIAEAEGADIVVTPGERLPERTFQDAQGRPVKLVQAVCRDKQRECGADLPRGSADTPLADGERARQLDNLLAYAPDLAVLRLVAPARTAALPLALHQQLDDQMRLVVRTYGAVPVGATAADAAARQQLVAPTSVAAVYTGPHQIDVVPRDGQLGDEIHVKLHRLAATVQPGQTGGPVLRGRGVVGVLTTLADPARGDGGAAPYAVPVTVLAGFLDLLKVPYIAVPREAPPPLAVSPAQPAAGAGMPGAQRWMLLGALALAVVAAGSFIVLARRKPPPAPPPLPPEPAVPQRTVSRVHPTLLHAVAMPTSALELQTAAREVQTAARGAATTEHTAPPQAAVRLHCAAGPLAPAVYTLPMPNGGTTLFVGRDANACQVVFPPGADEVSGVHACFLWDPLAQRLAVRDLSSSGTWVNGERLVKGRTQPLIRGDRVDLGAPERNRFKIEVIDDDGSAMEGHR